MRLWNERQQCLLLAFICVVGANAQTKPIDLELQLKVPFRFVAYGDTRFTDPSDPDASNAEVRRALVNAIAEADPSFISIGGDMPMLATGLQTGRYGTVKRRSGASAELRFSRFWGITT